MNRTLDHNHYDSHTELLYRILDGSVLRTTAVLTMLLNEAKALLAERGRVWPARLNELMSKLDCSGTDNDMSVDSAISEYRYDLEILYGLLWLGPDQRDDPSIRLDSLNLKDSEKEIILAIGDQSLIGKSIAVVIDRPHDSSEVRGTLSVLKNTRKILDNQRRGYFLRDEYRWLLAALREEQSVPRKS